MDKRRDVYFIQILFRGCLYTEIIWRVRCNWYNNQWNIHVYQCTYVNGLQHEFSTIKKLCSYSLIIHYGVVWPIMYCIERRSWVITITVYLYVDIGFNSVPGLQIVYFYCFLADSQDKVWFFFVLVLPYSFLSLSLFFIT